MTIGAKFMEALRGQLNSAQLRGDTALGAVRALKKDDILAHAKAQRMGLGAARPNEIMRRIQGGDKELAAMFTPSAQNFQQRVAQTPAPSAQMPMAQPALR